MADRVAPYTVGGMVAQSVNPRAAAVAEAYRRGILPPQQTAAYEHAIQRGLIKPDPQTRALMDARADVRARGNQPLFGFFGPKTGDVGRGSTDMANSMMFGFGDEINGAAAAAKAGLARLTGHDPGYSPQQAYAAARQAELEDHAGFANRHPAADVAAQLTGAIAGPGSVAGMRFVGRGSTLAARAGRSALASGAQGVVAGVGNADGGLKNRVTGGVTGGVVGTVTGGALPVAGRALSVAGRGAGRVVAEAARATGRAMNGTPLNVAAAPTQSESRQAFQRVLDLARSTGVSPADLDAAAASGKPYTTAEAIGRPAVTHAAALARRAGTTADDMNALISTRQQQMPNRVMDDFATATGIDPRWASGDIEQIVAGGQQRAAPMFDRALSQPGPIWNPALSDLSQRPSIQNALRAAHASLLDAGRDPSSVGIVLDPDTGSPVLGTNLQAVTEQQPTAEGWDLTRKMLNNMVRRDPLTGQVITSGPEGVGNSNLMRASQDLTGALRDAIPGYGDALDTSGDYLSAQDAFNQGRDLRLATQGNTRSLMQSYDGMAPPTQQAFTTGVMADVGDSLNRNRLAPRQLLTHDAQQKLQMIVPPDQFGGLMDNLSTEADLGRTGARMAPDSGSQTFPLHNAAGEQDAQSIADAAHMVGQAKNDKLGLLAKLWTLGSDHFTTPSTVGARNAMGDIYMAAPNSDHWQALHDALSQIPMPGDNQGTLGDAAAPALSALLASAMAPTGN